MNYFEELEIMEYVAEESGVLYEHQLDKDCYVFRDEAGLVLKAPKAIVDHPNLLEYLEKYK